jgi:recombination protein U
MGYWHSRGLRGSYLEDCINQSNHCYLEQGLAVVQKLPTAIKPVELDKERGTIKLAYFDEKSTVDYMGNVQGIPICFDAKETNQKRLPIANIHEHQIAFMDAFQKQDGLSFLIVLFKPLDEAYLLPFEVLKPYWDAAKSGKGRKSVPYADFDKRLRIPSEGNILIHYLQAINTYLEIRRNTI